MVALSAGAVVLVPFPFSDLSNSKLRPALVLAGAGQGDWVLCQITSKSYADPKAIEIRDTDFSSGSLSLTSYARPGKLFTANESLIVSRAGGVEEDDVVADRGRGCETLARRVVRKTGKCGPLAR